MVRKMKNERPQEKYDKENMILVTAKFKKGFVNEFKESCEKLGVTQSSRFRKVMEETIKEAKEINNR